MPDDPQLLAPSTRAASISSSGSACDQVLPHEEHPEGADQRGQDDRLQLVGPADSSAIIMYSGTTLSCGGIIIVPITSSSSSARGPEAQLGEGEAGQGGEEHGADGDRARHDQSC